MTPKQAAQMLGKRGGKKGGKARSPAKTKAARSNAKLPRKKESMEDRFKRETGFELGNPRSRKAVAS